MLIAVPVGMYFVVHRILRPLTRVYRRLRPIPGSPEPRSDDERYRLALVPAQKLERRFGQILDFLSNHSDEPLGNYVEFGVYNGTSMSCFHGALLRHGCANGTRLVGFDSFQGLPQDAELEDDGVWRAGQFTCPIEVARENLRRNGVPDERVELVEGWFAETLRRNPRSDLAPISVVMIDSDTRSAAELALTFIEPLLAKIAVICFDDWKLNDLDIKDMGEYRAFRDFARQHPELRIGISAGYSRKSKLAVICK